MDRHGRDLAHELADVGKLSFSRIHGLHFKFFDESLGGFYLRNVSDPSSYRGVQFDWLLIDELTEFSREDWDHLMYLLRSGKKLPFLSFGAATNPDGIGHGWVKRLWIDKDFEDEHELLRKTQDQFIFIPARAHENPAFDERVATQLQSFKNPLLVAARWEGSWDIASGVRFPQFKRSIHTFTWEEFQSEYGDHEPAELLKDKDLFAIYGSLDYGTDINAASAFYLHAVDWKKRVWTFGEVYMQGLFLREQADIMRPIIQDWGVRRTYADPSLQGKDSDGISRFSKFRDLGVPIVAGLNDRIEGWATLDLLLDVQYRLNSETGVREPISPPRWRIHRSECSNLVRQLATAPRDARATSGIRVARLEDIDPRFGDDHGLDSVRYMLHSYFKGTMPKPESLPYGQLSRGFPVRSEQENQYGW